MAKRAPSFHADDREGIYHCFGCGVTGDHFRFLTEKAGMSFPEAVEKLAGMAGVPMPARDEREESAAGGAAHALRRDGDGDAAISRRRWRTISGRGRGAISTSAACRRQAQTRFRIGFAPDSRNGLKEHLAANGVSAQEMIDTGLVVHARGRSRCPMTGSATGVMFPITDFRGRVIAFGGRALSAMCRPSISTRPKPSSSTSA